MRTGTFNQAEKAGLLEQLNEERGDSGGAALLQMWRSRHGANGPLSTLLLAQPFEERSDGIDRNGENRRGVLFCGNFHECLQVA